MNENNITKEELMKYICSNLGEDLDIFKTDEMQKIISSSEKCKELIKSLDLTVECYKNYKVDVPEDVHQRLINCIGLNDKK